MASLAPGGRIDRKIAEQEIGRLKMSWARLSSTSSKDKVLLHKYFSEDRIKNIDVFNRLQLESVLEICLSSDSMADAGRRLFSASRGKRKIQNDSDRLRKYLGKFRLKWEDIK